MYLSDEEFYYAENEYQNAFMQSCMNVNTTGDREKIREARLQGKFCVVTEYEACCPVTDALIAMVPCLISVHDTKEEALVAVARESDLYVVGPIQPPVVQPVSVSTDNEIPF